MRRERDGSASHKAERTTRRGTGAVVAVLGAVMMVVGLAPSPASGLQDATQQVALDPISPPSYGGDRCPDQGHWWNFRITPTDGTFAFTEIVLDLAGTTRSFSGAALVPVGGSMDNVLVEVPRGHGLDELRQPGSYAAVTPGTSDVTPGFSLGYLCYGPLAPTTTTTTTTTAPPASEPTVTGICYDVDVDGDVERYWHRLANDGDADVDVTWSDGSATIPANGTTDVSSANDIITISVAGDAVATTPAPPGEACTGTVRVTKRVAGPERPDGTSAPTYTMQVSRLVGAAYVPEGDPFELVGGETVEIPLPSTLDPEGVQYRVREIDAGDADAVSITPDTFVLNGHRTETIDVEVENAFAAIVLGKEVDESIAAPGDELVYTLVAENTGGVTLTSVTVYDRLPVEVRFTGADIPVDRGTCALVESTAPQLVRCDMFDALPPGATTPLIQIAADVVTDVDIDDSIVNQAMVIGEFDDTPNTGLHGGATRSDLTCVPTTGEVCDLAAASSGVLQLSSPPPPSTVAAQAPPTTVVANAGATATTIPFQLPATGASNEVLFVLGGLLVIVGGTLVLGSRRPRVAAER